MDDMDRRQESWHVGKEIPLAVLIMLMMQTVGGIWWLAQLSAKIDYAITTMQTFAAERYTREDAKHDREFFNQQLETMRQRDVEHERRLSILEQSHGRP
jgi:hypothetical protein